MLSVTAMEKGVDVFADIFARERSAHALSNGSMPHTVRPIGLSSSSSSSPHFFFFFFFFFYFFFFSVLMEV